MFIGPDPVADKIIFSGDPLFGSTARFHFISNVAMNDAGQIAFRYTLANDVSGIGVATPVIVSTSPGDFDVDGDVDGRDFLIWQRGGSPAPLSAGDLADWQANYGTGSLVATSVAVPEPSALVLAMITLSLVRCSRSARQQ
jgi:hypothetical protein